MAWLLIVFFALVLVSFFLYNFGKSTGKSREDYKSALDHKIKPLTRHPHIDHNICILCGSCIRACPETHGSDSPLGIVEGRLLLVNPAKCVGHAQCEIQCPTGALTVSLGELAEDPNMPVLSVENESVMPGIFIAGELSGVPLVRNAVEQGEKVIKAIAKRIHPPQTPEPGIFDVAIIGLGPSGLSATLSAHEHKLNYITLEQRHIGGTVANYPKQKMIMTQPIHLPLYGVLKKKEIMKEELIELWNSMVKKYQLNLHVGEKVESIVSENGFFEVTAGANVVKAKNVVLCMGRRGTPRKLGIPGEDLSKVTYGLLDPEAYQKKKIIVVGGGDSAIEAACVLSESNDVILSYRKDTFFRIKDRNLKKIDKAKQSGKVKIIFNSELTEITEKTVQIKENDKITEYENDYIFVLIGGEPAFPLLRSTGVLKDSPKPQEPGVN
ncbi:MAG: NAD(P)-binding domain-containing protein [Spirochaetia bacterium]|nr:NAD(P)-binding domain-containing protein [Spirochaetia bacterium]